MRTYLYVDGESHFIRSCEAFRIAKGPDVQIERLGNNCVVVDHPRLRAEIKHFAFDEKGKFLWVHEWVYHLGGFGYTRPGIERKVYFTSYQGDEEGIYNLKLLIRSHNFEPVVTKERRTLAQQRKNLLTNENVLEKAKGVDIGMAVRILEDAYMNNFDQCVIFTSDVDFVPVIEAIRRKGKRVILGSYREGLGPNSPLLHISDEFWDLSDWMSRIEIAEVPATSS